MSVKASNIFFDADFTIYICNFSDVICPWKNDEKDAKVVRNELTADESDQNESEQDETKQDESDQSETDQNESDHDEINQNESEEDETDQEGSDVEEIDEDEPIEIVDENDHVDDGKKRTNSNLEVKNDVIATDIEIDNFISEEEMNVKKNQERKSVDTNKIDETIEIKTENLGGNNRKRKSFPCTLCDKTYTQSHSLKSHVKKVHEGLNSPTDFGIKKRKTVEVASLPPPPEFNNWIEDLNQTKNDDNNVHKGHFLANVEDPKNSFEDTIEKSTTIKLEENFENAKTFSCQSCDKSYTQSHILRRHIKNVHEGIKEYSCKFCDKSYTQSHNLKTHIRKVHEGLESAPASAEFKISKVDRTNSDSEKFAFTPEEVDRLETSFRAKKHINTFEIEKLGKYGNFPEDKVQEWFENRRLNTSVLVNGEWYNKTI